ncbi:MAG: tyrosine-type recombinase/integrase [Nitrososphaera sp.]|nr:tyrosine-type recombinase/integrase [Nitrososphaera sp.]
MNERILPWSSLVKEYVSYRRKLGYALTSDADLLLNFAKYAENVCHEGPLTTEMASQWARSSKRNTPFTWADRIQRLRGFARYCQRYHASTEIPPRQLFGVASRRLVPHIFTVEEIETLLTEATYLRPKGKLRPVTCRALFGLLASTGLRISEAVNLTRADVDLQSGILKIREAKRHKQRLVPLHPTVVSELQAYANERDQIIPKTSLCNFFIFDSDTPADPQRLGHALRFLCKKLGWKPRGEHHRFRLYDFRHFFIVRCFLQFHERGIDVHRAVLQLSVYVGHSDVSSTYWYVTGIPELMTIAAERFRTFSMEGAHE